jgi:hypothetical protein
MAIWAAKWRSKSLLDGKREHLILFRVPYARVLFASRAACRAWIEQEYGYIKHRPDLRGEPHGWRLPVAVKVTIREFTIREATNDA